jgi:hypothetical protein
MLCVGSHEQSLSSCAPVEWQRTLGTYETAQHALFSIAREELKERHRGDNVSDARKALAYIAAKEYRAPLHVVAEYLGIGRTAVSALSRQGRDIVKRKEFVI